MRRLTIQSPLDSFTSYGITFQKIFFGLRKRGIHVSIRPTKIQTPFGTTIPSDMLACVVNGPQPEPWEVIFGPMLYLPTPGKKVFYWTTHESHDIPKDKLDLLARADVVMLMNKDLTGGYQSEVRSKKGAIGYLPLGVDTAVFKPGECVTRGFFNFGTAGRLAHGWHRKGVGRVIEVFRSEFRSDDAVRLYVKLHPDCELDDPSDARVIITRCHLPETQIVRWIQNLHCYVSGASYEGFGLWPLQAMACGIPVVAIAESGMDYLGGYPATLPLNDAELSAAMRYSYESRNDPIVSTKQSVEIASRWSLDRCIDQFIDRLEECGALPRESLCVKLWNDFKGRHNRQAIRLPNRIPDPFRVIHVYPVYLASESDQQRIDMAKQTWSVQNFTQLGLTNGLLPREWIDENRRLPYVKDLIDAAAKVCEPGDVILISNSDICFASNLFETIAKTMANVPAVMFPRRQFSTLTGPVADERIVTGDKQPGWDAFAFRAAWWESHKSEMPDMLFGAEAWDSVLAQLIGVSPATEIDGAVYHVEHVPFWKDNRFTISSQKYNRALARRFFKAVGAASPVDPDPEPKAPENLI